MNAGSLVTHFVPGFDFGHGVSELYVVLAGPMRREHDGRVLVQYVSMNWGGAGGVHCLNRDALEAADRWSRETYSRWCELEKARQSQPTQCVEKT